MSAPLLLVEGDDDKTFLGLLAKQYLGIEADKLEVKPFGSKYSLDEPLKANVRAGVIRIGVAKDLNSNSPAEVVAQISAVLSSEFAEPVSQEGSILVIKNSRVVVIPMGLYQDPVLNSVGVARHSMEDYLLKAFLDDRQLWHHANVRNATAFLQDVLAVCDRHGVRPTSSKDVWHFVKGLPEMRPGSRASIEWVLAHCDKNTFGEIAANPLARLGLLTEGSS